MATLGIGILTTGLSEEAAFELSPLASTLAAIAVFDRERRSGAVYGVTNDEDLIGSDVPQGDFIVKYRTEHDVLAEFWEGARSYDIFVTFNGRRFAAPYLLLRSALSGVTPSVDLMEHRYLKYQRLARHIDLFDQLTFYGAVGKWHSLDDFCKSFSISPAVDFLPGYDVAAGAANAVLATVELYEMWLKRLAPPWFINTIEI